MPWRPSVLLAFVVLHGGCKSRSFEEQLSAANQANAKLLEIANAELVGYVAEIRGRSAPNAKPTGAAAFQAFLKTVKSVGTYCSGGAKDTLESYEKFNKTELVFTFQNGAVVPAQYTGRHCGEDEIIMRLDFQDGRIVSAQSDGTERKYEPSHARNALREIVQKLEYYDREKHGALYFTTEEERQKQIGSAW